ncbi:MAG: cellulase N-terminal Ig-like domain-containing protein [Acetatifactor sp.]
MKQGNEIVLSGKYDIMNAKVEVFLNRNRMIKGMTCCCLAVAIATGCGAQADSDSVKSPYASAVSMEGTPVIDYAVPQFLPNILVDAEGYCLGEEMAAVLKGRRLPEQFSLVDAVSGDVVYIGAVEEIAYNEELDLYTGYADFSEVDKQGEYYLQCDIIGESNRFSIEKQLYGRLFTETYGGFMEKCRDRSLKLDEAVALLEAYEWYSAVFPDEDENQIPDVLEEVKSWVAYKEENGVEASEEALYAALLAKFSYIYQKFDFQYATDCLKRASTVFGQLQPTLSRDADSFFALTELYRATGLYTYRNQIVDYKSFFENNSSYLEEQGYLYGSMTYLVTRHKVDLTLCENFMGNLMDRAEEISKRYEDMLHPATAKNNGSTDLLKNATMVSCANYCMNNYQYTNICEEFLHYLMGRNRESVNFYESDEDRIGYLLLLAGLAAK